MCLGGAGDRADAGSLHKHGEARNLICSLPKVSSDQERAVKGEGDCTRSVVGGVWSVGSIN